MVYAIDTLLTSGGMRRVLMTQRRHSPSLLSPVLGNDSKSDLDPDFPHSPLVHQMLEIMKMLCGS